MSSFQCLQVISILVRPASVDNHNHFIHVHALASNVRIIHFVSIQCLQVCVGWLWCQSGQVTSAGDRVIQVSRHDHPTHRHRFPLHSDTENSLRIQIHL